MNSVNLIGNLTKDPELRYSTGQNQTAICRFTLAINEGYGEKQRTNFIPILTFGKIAENCDRYLSKGKKAGVKGHIQTGSYEKEGRTIYTTEVVAEAVEFLSSSQQGQQPAPQQSEQPAPPQEPQQAQMDMPEGGFMPTDNNDIPW